MGLRTATRGATAALALPSPEGASAGGCCATALRGALRGTLRGACRGTRRGTHRGARGGAHEELGDAEDAEGSEGTKSPTLPQQEVNPFNEVEAVDQARDEQPKRSLKRKWSLRSSD